MAASVVACEARHLQHFLDEILCKRLGLELHVDASSAIQILSRPGPGRLRHLSTRQLWLQKAVLQNELTLVKVPGNEHVADLFTKAVDRSRLNCLKKMLCID
jgi:hypothetical protein